MELQLAVQLLAWPWPSALDPGPPDHRTAGQVQPDVEPTWRFGRWNPVYRVAFSLRRFVMFCVR